ncbi:MAG: MBL fold metallo-hydrolase [Alphaproteobacteria bacterium]|nr:MBL fold metallo-hydrolase [Alphaproteobacteria bacterium]
MKVTILGCGGSAGVPMIGNEWGNCDPNEPRNVRLRSSILVEDKDQVLLVDTSPDMREQLLRADIKDLTAIFYTHAHADHCHGIDNIRTVNWMTRKPMPVYGNEVTIKELTHRFEYIFQSGTPDKFYRPAVEVYIIQGPMDFGDIHVTTYPLKHGRDICLGYRFNDFAYSTDVSEINEAAFEALRGVKVWVVDAVREEPHHSHAHLERTLEWIERVKPAKAYLTHMNQTMDYCSLRAKLPHHVEPAYDGLVIEL